MANYIRGAKGRFAGSRGGSRGGGGRGGTGGGSAVSRHARGSGDIGGAAARGNALTRANQGRPVMLMNKGQMIGTATRKGGFARTNRGTTVTYQNRRNGSTRSMESMVVARARNGRAILVRNNNTTRPGSRPTRAPFQRGLTRRTSLVVQRSNGQVARVKIYSQKVRVPRDLSPGASRAARTATVISPRGRRSP
jgi:hypothetical protein